jgi:hypothetical protein
MRTGVRSWLNDEDSQVFHLTNKNKPKTLGTPGNAATSIRNTFATTHMQPNAKLNESN